MGTPHKSAWLLPCLIIEGAVQGNKVDAGIALQAPRISVHLGSCGQQVRAAQLAFPVAAAAKRGAPAVSTFARQT